MTSDRAIRPTLAISGRQNHGAAIHVHIEFVDFDKAMEFNAMVVDWLMRELSRDPPDEPPADA